MKKRSISILLITSMLLWMVPAAGVYGQDRRVSSKTYNDAPEAVEGQVVVLYEDGAVDTKAPETKTEKRKVMNARRADSFGSAMDDASGSKGAAEAENTLGQQDSILTQTLGTSYVIEDTVVLDASEDGSDETILSTVSSDKYTAEELAEKLSANENIAAAEPNYIFHALDMPDWNDTFISDAWQNTDKGVNADKVWNDPALSGDGDPVVIAVLDSGIDYEHEDLAGRMWTEPEGFKLKGFHGMDFVEKDDDPMDYNGHGTHCAGIIAAAADNAAGTAGIAGRSDKVQLMAVRVLDEEGSGTFEDIISAFYYIIRAKNAGANIRAINCSLGAAVSSDIFDKVLDKTGEAGILTVCAAGNEASDNDQLPSAPANCKSEYVISVAALDDNGELSSYTNYGTKNVDIAAPGSNILSSVSYDNYAPYLYDNDRIGRTTEYYGEFGGAELITEADSQGKTVQKVTPVSGTDYAGAPVTSTGTFGESVMASESAKGTATLELVEGDDASFNIGNNRMSLRWKISGAESGDKFVLMFPYDKMATGFTDTYANMVFRTHSDETYMSGTLEFGDIILHVDKNGGLTYRAASSEAFYGSEFPVSKDWNSIWQASGNPEVLYPYSEIRSLSNNIAEEPSTAEQADSSGEIDGYGLGFVYTAENEDDVYIDLSSLAISKAKVDPSLFGHYDVFSGTSMAAPVATGSAGLIAAMEPDLSAAELRDRLFETTRDGYQAYCSTGGAVDFSAYTKEVISAKPVISSAICDFDNKTVELRTSNAGMAPEITAKFNFADRTEQIAPEDITAVDDKIIIADKYGLIGSDVTFTIRNTLSGLSGHRTLYLVKGLKSYSELFKMDAYVADDWLDFWSKDRGPESVYDDEEEGNSFPSGLTYIKGADKFLLYDADNIYRLFKDENGNYTVDTIGAPLSEFMEDYAAKQAKKTALWAPDEDDKKIIFGNSDDAEGIYTLEMIGEPAVIGNIVYTLVRADLTDREAFVLLGLDTANGNKWTVYYDSLTDFGTAPAELKFNDLLESTFGAYDGKLYLFDGYDSDDEGKPTSNTRVFSCTPSAKGSNWERSADMTVPVSNGKVLAQGGDLYYFFGMNSDFSVDYNVYRFDGKEWTLAGKLPPAVYKTDGDISMMAFFGSPGEGMSCAYGIDSEGLIFAGRSFDEGGDTFRFNTTTGKIEDLGYTLWGDVADRSTDGTIAGGKLLVQYSSDDGEKVTAKTIPVKTGYMTVKVKTSGKGKGTVTGAGSFTEGEKSHIMITPAKGSYIYQIRTTGLTPDLNKKYGKSTKASKAALQTDFSGKANATITVHFGKYSTKLTVKKVKSVKVGKRKLKAYTDGTISGVKWKSSNKKYAKVNKNGTITFTKKGIGKTVKLTAVSKENPKLKKTIKVKIKKK